MIKKKNIQNFVNFFFLKVFEKSYNKLGILIYFNVLKHFFFYFPYEKLKIFKLTQISI